MAEEREGKRSKVRALIENATTSTLSEVDPRLLNAIKSLVRYSDSELRLAFHTLFDLMKRDHSQVRYLTLLIIDELFMRSKLFRGLVVENMDMLLTLSVGFRKNQPLPAPPAVAALLRSKAIEFLEKWNESFGFHYRRVRLGFDYLKNTLRLQFPNLQANAARVRQEREERERRSKEILLNKYETLKQNFEPVREEIESTVREIGECLEIARGGEERVALGPFDEEDFVEFRCSEFRQIRLSALEEGEKVHENSENKVVFDALRELYKLVVSKHLVSVQEWISVLVRVEVTDNKLRDSLLKETIDVKNRLQSVKKECEDAGLALRENGDNEEEEDFWEEGTVRSLEIGNSGDHCEGNKDVTVASTSRNKRDIVSASGGKKVAAKKMVDHRSNSLKGKLLAEAPVVNWGPHLDDWGSKRDVLANQRGLELDGHWGRVDYNAVIPAEKIEELFVQASLYREAQVEIQPCRAPLRKGGLCSRRDLKVCPFHGPVIPRDDEGKPIDQRPPKDKTTSGRGHGSDKKVAGKSQADSDPDLDEKLLKSVCKREDPETTSDFGTDLVEKLARQAVKSVRERDIEAARKAQLDKRAQKRAKLAEVREHNALVLRDAALASTSRSANIGEDMEASNARNPSTRNSKQKLASMIRKKVTAKDRISRRLLNRGASDTTMIQLAISEDANYREAFPNQW